MGLVEVTDEEGRTKHLVEPGSFTHGIVALCCLLIKAQDRWGPLKWPGGKVTAVNMAFKGLLKAF